MAGITDLRFLKRTSLNREQDLHKEYLRDIIRSYGVDVSYFRKDLSFFQVPSGLCNYTYGEDTTATYFLSSFMVVYSEMMGDAFLLNNFGIETDGDMAIYFMIDDFTRQYQDIIGTPTSAYISAFLSAGMSSYSGVLSAMALAPELSASCSAYLSASTSGDLSGTVSLAPYENAFVHYRIEHPNIYPYNRAIAGNLTGSYTGTLDVSGNGSVTGTVAGTVNYFKTPSIKHGTGFLIAPQVGDFFRLDFQSDENMEEYEIASVNQRDLQNSGLNALLGSYMWKCVCNRRDPSSETVLSGMGIQEEPLTASKSEQAVWTEVTSNSIFDYSQQPVDQVDGVNSDSVYGNY